MTTKVSITIDQKEDAVINAEYLIMAIAEKITAFSEHFNHMVNDSFSIMMIICAQDLN